MLLLLSPAKSLDFATPVADIAPTEPLFVRQAAQLIALLRKKKVADIASLMDLSEELSRVNFARYKAWRRAPAPQATRAAVLAFDGDVYGGLNARDLGPADLDWAQDHVCILSGLYGVLRPLDRMQPYRLEMSTRLPNPHGDNLYRFWGGRIAEYLNQRLASEAAPIVVNLASQEYAKAVDRKVLRARMVECVFEELRNGQHKVISFSAKRARGLMARFAVQRRITEPEVLQEFRDEGYAFDHAASHPERMVFRRAAPA